MSKLSRKEKEKIEKQTVTNHRDMTWVGIRPAVFKDKTRDKKRRRRDDKIRPDRYED